MMRDTGKVKNTLLSRSDWLTAPTLTSLNSRLPLASDTLRTGRHVSLSVMLL